MFAVETVSTPFLIWTADLTATTMNLERQNTAALSLKGYPMSPDADSILDAALRLPEDVRLSLVSRLLESLPPEDLALSLEDPRLAEELDRRFTDREGAVPWSELKSDG